MPNDKIVQLAGAGNEKALKAIKGTDYDKYWLPLALERAAENGHDGCVKFLIKEGACNGTPTAINAIAKAAAHGHLTIVEKLAAVPDSNVENALKTAAEAGQIRILKFLYNQGVSFACVNRALQGVYGEGEIEISKKYANKEHEWGDLPTNKAILVYFLIAVGADPTRIKRRMAKNPDYLPFILFNGFSNLSELEVKAKILLPEELAKDFIEEIKELPINTIESFQKLDKLMKNDKSGTSENIMKRINVFIELLQGMNKSEDQKAKDFVRKYRDKIVDAIYYIAPEAITLKAKLHKLASLADYRGKVTKNLTLKLPLDMMELVINYISATEGSLKPRKPKEASLPQVTEKEVKDYIKYVIANHQRPKVQVDNMQITDSVEEVLDLDRGEEPPSNLSNSDSASIQLNQVNESEDYFSSQIPEEEPLSQASKRVKIDIDGIEDEVLCSSLHPSQESQTDTTNFTVTKRLLSSKVDTKIEFS